MASQPKKPKVPDAYFDLGLTPAASRGEVKAAYHRLALLHHPDKKVSEGTDAADFRRANEAYELLKDEQAKAHYDKSYTRLQASWLTYRKDLAEFEKNPAAWRKKKAEEAQEQARAAAAQRRQAQSQYMHDDSDDSSDYQWWPFGPSSGRAHSRSDWQSEFEQWWAYRKEEQRNYDEYRRRELAEELAREKKAEEAGKRAIEQQKKEAELQHANTDGIRGISSAKKLAMAKIWVQGIQRKYAEELELQRLNFAFYSKKVIDLGWEKRKGPQTCHFCDAHVHEYSYRCPNGGAIACRGCKNEITFSSLDHPFSYVNTHSGANKGRGKKGKGKKKTKKNKTKNAQESESDGSEDESESGNDADGQATENPGSVDAAQGPENTRVELEARRQAAREAHDKAARLKAEKADRDKADAERAAQEKATFEAEARKAAEHNKTERAMELQQEKVQKKVARKKAAKEKAALARAQVRSAEEEEAHKQVAEEQQRQERRLYEKDMRDQTQEKEGPERDARQAHENAMRLAKETAKCEAKDCEELEAVEYTGRAKQQSQKLREETKIQQERERIPAATTHEQGPSLISNTTAVTKNSKKKKASSHLRVCFICNEEGHATSQCPNKSTKATTGINGVTQSLVHAISPINQQSTQPTSKEPTSTHGIKVKLPPDARRGNPSKSNRSQVVASNINGTAQTLPQASVTSGQGIEEPTTRDLSDELVASGSERVKVKLPQQPKKHDHGSRSVSIEGSIASTTQIEDAPKLPQSSASTKAPRRPLVCYICKEKGHILRNCPNKVKNG
jgi:curved DNA-binding protein CbpA